MSTNSRFAVSPQTSLQEVGELRVPVGNVTLLKHKGQNIINTVNVKKAGVTSKTTETAAADLVGQSGDNDAQVGQRAVDGGHLFETVTLRLALHHSLTASQVHQAQSGYIRADFALVTVTITNQTQYYRSKKKKPHSWCWHFQWDYTHICTWHPCRHWLPQYPAGRLSGSETSGHSGLSGQWSDSDWPKQSDREPERTRERFKTYRALIKFGNNLSADLKLILFWATDVCLLYLILIGDPLISEISDCHFVAGCLADLVLRSLAGLAGVQKVPQGLIVNFDKARCERELK